MQCLLSKLPLMHKLCARTKKQNEVKHKQNSLQTHRRFLSLLSCITADSLIQTTGYNKILTKKTHTEYFTNYMEHHGSRDTQKLYRGGSTLGQGAVAPQIHLLPQIQKLADHSNVTSEVPKCSKIQIFRGSVLDELTLLTQNP